MMYPALVRVPEVEDVWWSGEVRCPQRMARMGWGRCVRYQDAGVCGCEVGEVARLVEVRYAEYREEEVREPERHGLECRWCGVRFDYEGVVGRKPMFCGVGCRVRARAEKRRRDRRRKGVVGGVWKAGVSGSEGGEEDVGHRPEAASVGGGQGGGGLSASAVPM